MLIVTLYVAFLLTLGFVEFRKQEGLEGFLVGNRRMSAFEVGVSMMATCVGGTATIGVVGNVARSGFPAIWWLLSGALGLGLLAALLAKTVRRTGAMTLPEIMETFISKKARLLGAGIIAAAWISILAAQFSASARIMSAFGIPFGAALWLSCGVIALYTGLGGQTSVIKSDVWQYLLVIAAFVGVLSWFGCNDSQAFALVRVEWANDRFTPTDIGVYLLFVGASYVIDPMLFSRILSAKDERSAVAGAFLGAAGIALSGVAIVCAGFVALRYALADTPPDALLTSTLFRQLPPALGVALLLGLLSAVVSSADTVLITVAGVFAHDILRSKSLATYRAVTLLFAGVALFLANRGGAILDYLLAANDIFIGGVAAPLFFAMIFKGKVHAPTVLAGMALGGALGLVSSLGSLLNSGGILDSKMYSVAGIALSTLCCLAARVRHRPVAV